MKSDLLTTVRLVILSVVVCCILYPGVMLAFGQALVPWRANGSMLTNGNGEIIGSALIAQNFNAPEYFWPRPSAVDHDAAGTGGSNLSPTSPELAVLAEGIIGRYGLETGQTLPADLVSASGSGVDPHITLSAARFQISRVAAARGLSEQEVEALIEESTDARTLLVFGGDPVVNVLQLNLALDRAVAGNGR